MLSRISCGSAPAMRAIASSNGMSKTFGLSAMRASLAGWGQGIAPQPRASYPSSCETD